MSKLRIATKYSGGWVAALSLVDREEDFPEEVFLWTIEPDGSLGEFIGIVHFLDIDKYPIHDPSKSSNFGQRVARTSSGLLKADTKVELAAMITVVKSGFTLCLSGYLEDGAETVETFPA